MSKPQIITISKQRQTGIDKGCPACDAGRYHTKQEFEGCHPDAGHGYTKESGDTQCKEKRLSAFLDWNHVDRTETEKRDDE